MVGHGEEWWTLAGSWGFDFRSSGPWCLVSPYRAQIRPARYDEDIFFPSRDFEMLIDCIYRLSKDLAGVEYVTGDVSIGRRQ